ncbi:MAG: radical SAM protein [Bacteroidales bacterium]|jgi:histone acetyltransferase (RNA polymerase elongator complex component)
MRHYNIPIFIPELACPNQCIYCNQRYISGQIFQPTKEEIIEKIDSHLKTFQDSFEAEVAFFGGSFTGIEIDKQIEYLKIIQPYIDKGIIKSIRISTRPDYINEHILDILKQYRVKTIELGAQSLSQDVLDFSQRGHSVEDVENASKLINGYGFELGLQMMIGLPKDTIDKSIQTAKKIIEFGAKNTRIYPTLVIEKTKLADQYRKGEYQALTIEKAVDWTAIIYKIFYDAGIKILRVGLHPSEALINKTELLAGAFHVSFRELVLTKIWYENLQTIKSDASKILTIYTAPNSINQAVGYNSTNKIILKQRFKQVVFKIEEGLNELEFRYSLF